MKIVKRDSFRSQGTLVNKTDDMYRVVVDMTRGEFFAFSQWAARQENKESPENSPASPVQHSQDAIAQNIVAALEDDITDRRGLKHEWHRIDSDVLNEIRAEWKRIVLQHLG